VTQTQACRSHPRTAGATPSTGVSCRPSSALAGRRAAASVCGRLHGAEVTHLGDGRWWDAERHVWRDGRGRRVRGLPAPEMMEATQPWLAAPDPSLSSSSRAWSWPARTSTTTRVGGEGSGHCLRVARLSDPLDRSPTQVAKHMWHNVAFRTDPSLRPPTPLSESLGPFCMEVLSAQT
jgi:hypothetical protein